MIMMRHTVNNNTRMGLVIFLYSNSDHLISLIPPPPPPNCLKFWTFTQLWYYSCLHGVHQTSAICCLITEVRPRVFRDFNTAFRSFVCFKRLDINNVISKRVISNYTFNIHFLMSEIISSSKKVHCY